MSGKRPHNAAELKKVKSEYIFHRAPFFLHTYILLNKNQHVNRNCFIFAVFISSKHAYTE